MGFIYQDSLYFETSIEKKMDLSLKTLSSYKQNRLSFIKVMLSLSLCSFIPYKNLKFMKPKGVTIRQSLYPVNETIDRLQEFLLQHGATIYARINQQNEATNVGINLPPLEFILFGNPKAGSPIMIENPLVALDLPLKIIAYEDDRKKVWLAYNEAGYIEERYSLSHNENSPLALDHVIDMAMKP